MPTIISENKSPECPLCLKPMTEIVEGKQLFWACFGETCMVSINQNDPCVGKWRERPGPSCPLCNEPMRQFFRLDRLIIMQCHSKEHNLFQIKKGNAENLPPLTPNKATKGEGDG